tara:strand:- start:477 stop:578 length:102 start_codon:yes stop_codon:yes gene_type:complete
LKFLRKKKLARTAGENLQEQKKGPSGPIYFLFL